MKALLNVIVGAGAPEYFSNCVASVSKLCPHDILAIYNWVDKRDFDQAAAIKAVVASPKTTVFLQQNETNARTGSLYSAYNSAINYGLGAYRYISFIQADMQMMWWNDSILDACDAGLQLYETEKKGKICFYSQIPVQGKRVDFFSQWANDGEEYVKLNAGAVDVAIYPLEPVFGSGYRFSGSEQEFSESSAARGVSVALHPYPFLAPIPYPITLRDKRTTQKRKSPVVNQLPILKPSEAAKKLVDFSRSSFHPMLMEDVVVPNGWTALTPYWPSDTRGSEWLRTRWQLARENAFPFLRVQSGEEQHRVRLRFRPGFVAIGRAALLLLFRESILKYRKWRQSRLAHENLKNPQE